MSALGTPRNTAEMRHLSPGGWLPQACPKLYLRLGEGTPMKGSSALHGCRSTTSTRHGTPARILCEGHDVLNWRRRDRARTSASRERTGANLLARSKC